MKLKFWEKEDDFGLSNTDPLSTGASDITANPINPPPDMNNSFNQFEQKPIMPQNSPLEKDLNLIIAKLDAIKSELDNINMRIQNLEKPTVPGQKQYRW